MFFVTDNMIQNLTIGQTMNQTISVTQAAGLVGCSTNHIREKLKDGTLTRIMALKGTRQIYRLSEDEVLKYAESVRENSKIGRKNFGPVRRKPYLNKGYRYIHYPNHPRAKAGYVPEHILVMEASLGRFLDSDEHVHHRDRDRQNNDISNLQVVSQSEHMRMHARLRSAFMRVSNRPELEDKLLAYIDELLKNT